MADAEEGAAEAEDVAIVESTTPTTMATPAPSRTEIATEAGGGIESINRTEVAPPSNV